jgi:hypothetical protein
MMMRNRLDVQAGNVCVVLMFFTESAQFTTVDRSCLESSYAHRVNEPLPAAATTPAHRTNWFECPRGSASFTAFLCEMAFAEARLKLSQTFEHHEIKTHLSHQKKKQIVYRQKCYPATLSSECSKIGPKSIVEFEIKSGCFYLVLTM